MAVFVAEPVQRIRTVAFVDLCGFSAYTRAHGDRAAADQVMALRERLREAADRHGVDIVKWTGDGAMIAGRDAESVKSCTTAVIRDTAVQGALALRAGIAEGPVLAVEGDDLIGATVNRAAQLCGEASRDEVLVDARR